jgi:phage-related protein (TIGR01555 family)
MAWITDSLRTAIAAVNPFNRGHQQGGLEGVFSSQLAIAAYLSSGMMRKVVNIPANDRVREWRDWQADKEQIELLEAEEKRLALIAKVKFAEVLRGIGGGALILITPGDHSQPLNPATLRKGGLVAINVASRWQIRATDFVKDLASPDYGMPTVFKVESGGKGPSTAIHPSRVICFRGDPLPAGAWVSDEDAFWGDSRLVRVLSEVSKSDNASLWFAELVKKAKLLRFGVSNLTDYNQDDLNARVALIASGENSINATIYNLPTKDGQGSEVGGEKIDDYQVTWTGIPAMQDMFDQRIAAVADIPFTRLMGRSPAGMNATGAYDDQNWSKAVSSGQQLETRPCLEQLDPLLIRSAGVADPSKVTWKWAPLWAPTEAEEATTFKTTMEAVTALQNTGTIPDEAMARGVQNLMSEREWVPGLDQALALIPEDERFGLVSKPPADGDDTDPSSIQAEGGDPDLTGVGGDGSVPRRRAANDKVPDAQT